MAVADEKNIEQSKIIAPNSKPSTNMPQHELESIAVNQKIAPIYLNNIIRAKEMLAKANGVYDGMTAIFNKPQNKSVSELNVSSIDNLQNAVVGKGIPAETKKLLDEMSILHSRMKNIASPKTGDNGLNVFRDALASTLAYHPIKGLSSNNPEVLMQQLGDLAVFLDYLDNKRPGSTIRKSAWLDIETVGEAKDIVHMYDYSFFQTFRNTKGEIVQKSSSELLGFSKGSAIHKRLLDLKAKLEAGNAKLDQNELWEYEYLSRLGQSFRENLIGNVYEGPKKTAGLRLTQLTTKPKAEFMTVENLDLAINELTRIGEAQLKDNTVFSFKGASYSISNAHRRLIENVMASLSEKRDENYHFDKTILGGHNIGSFDNPILTRVLDNIPSGNEYFGHILESKKYFYQGERIKPGDIDSFTELFGLIKKFDTNEIQKNLDTKRARKLAKRLGIYTKEGETLGMAEVISRALFGIGKAHHSSMTDAVQEYEFTPAFFSEVLKTFGVDTKKYDTRTKAVNRFKEIVGRFYNRRGKNNIFKDEIAPSGSSILMKMNVGGSSKSIGELKGLYGITQKGNSYSAIDGTTYTVFGFDENGTVKSLRTENDRYARSLWDKDAVYEVYFAEQLKDAKEKEVAAAALGVPNNDRNPITRFYLRQYGIGDGLSSREQTTTMIYATEEMYRNFIGKNAVIGKSENGVITLSDYGKEFFKNTYRTSGDAFSPLLKDGSEDISKAISDYNRSITVNRVAESASRRIEEGSLNAVLKSEGIRNIVTRANAGNNEKSYEKALDELQYLLGQVIFNKDGKSRSALEDALDLAIKNGLKKEELLGFGPESTELTKQALADLLASGFSFRDKSSAYIPNSGWMDNTFYLARTLEPGSYLLGIAKKANAAKLGKQQVKSVVSEALAMVVANNRQLYEASGLSEEEIAGKILQDMGAITSRGRNLKDELYIPLSNVGKKVGREAKPLGITLARNNNNSLYSNVTKIKSFAMDVMGESGSDLEEFSTYLKVLSEVALKNDLWEPIPGLTEESGEAFSSQLEKLRKRVSRILSPKNAVLMSKDEGIQNRPIEILTDEVFSALADLAKTRRKFGDKVSGLNPSATFTASASALGKTMKADDEKAVEDIISRALKGRRPLSSDDIAELKGAAIKETEFKKQFEGYSRLGKDARYNIFTGYQKSVRQYYSDMTQLAKEYGGTIILKDGQFFVEFPGEGLVSIDKIMLGLEQSGTAIHYRLGRSAYNAKLKVKLADDGSLNLVTHLDQELARAFKKTDNGKGLSSAERRMENALLEKRSLGNAFLGIFGNIFKPIRQDALEDMSTLNDSAINYSFNFEELISTGYGRKKLTPLLEQAKRNVKGETYAKIKDLLAWMEREDSLEKKNASEYGYKTYTGIKAKNDFWSLVAEGIIPNTVKVGEYTYRINRDAKITKAGRSGLATLFNDNTTWSKPFESIGRESSYLENKTIRFNKGEIEERIGRLKGSLANSTIYGNKSSAMASILGDRSLIRHAVELTGEKDSVVGAVEKNIRVRQLEANTKDINEIRKLMGKSLLRDIFNKNSLEELTDEQRDFYQEVLNRFTMRAQVYEGGGNISGRIVAASGYYQGDRTVNMAYRYLDDDTRWNSIKDKLEAVNGEVTGFRYGSGFIVKGYNPNAEIDLSKEALADSQIFRALSEYGDTEERNLAARSSIIRRRFQSRSGHVLTDSQVLTHVKAIAAKQGIRLDEKTFMDIAEREFETVAQINVLSPNNYAKVLTELGEKHVASVNMEELGMAARLARAKGKNEETSALLNLLANEDFQDAVKIIKDKTKIDILEDNLRFDVIEDFASGRLQNEIWQQLKEAKKENNTDLYTLIKAAVVKANNLSNGSSLEEDIYSGIFSISDIIENVTGANIISQDIAAAIKHGKETSASETWAKLVEYEIGKAVALGGTEAAGIASAKKRFDRVFYDREWVAQGNKISSVVGRSYVLEDIDQNYYHFDTNELYQIRKELRSAGVKIGDYISGDYLDDEGNIQNVYSGSKFLVRNSYIQYMRDAANFDKKASWGIREKSSLENAIVYASDLSDIKVRMDRFNGVFSFEDLFGDTEKEIRKTGAARGFIWQRDIGKGLTVSDLILRNSATFALGDTIYNPDKAQGKTWLDREKKKLYDLLIKDESMKDTPIGDMFLSDLAESRAGRAALALQNRLIGGEYAGNLDRDSIIAAQKAFGLDIENRLETESGAKAVQVVKASELMTNTKNSLDSIRSGQQSRFFKYDRNFILDIAGDDAKLQSILDSDSLRYLYVPGSELKPVMPGSNTPALTPAQESAKRIAEDAKRYLGLKKRLENPNEDKDYITEQMDVIEKRLKKATTSYSKVLDEQYRNHKSILNSKWTAIRQEFSDRGKVNVYDVASLIRGEEYSEIADFEYNGRKFKDIFAAKFDKEGNIISGPTAMPDFIIASTKDLEKYGYTDEYFKKAYMAVENISETTDSEKLQQIEEGARKFKEQWLARAKTKGVEALGNRSPSDYIFSSNAVRLYFSDNVTRGISLISSITAAKMKADSDGDTAMKMMLGVRNKSTSQWLDLNTFNMLTDEGRDKDKIEELKQKFGDANAIDELIELNRAHALSVANSAFSGINKGFLSEGSSIDKYSQFLASSESAKGYRLKNIINKQREIYFNKATNGIIYARQTGALTQTELAKMTTDWNQAEDIARRFFDSKLFTDETYKAQRESLATAIKDTSVLIKNAYGSSFDEENFNLKDFYTKLRANRESDFARLTLYNQVLRNVAADQDEYGQFFEEGDIETLEKGIKAKRKHVELLTEFFLKNNQQGVGEIDTGILDMELISGLYDRFGQGLDKKSRASIQYFKESAKEGFLTTKKGEDTIRQKLYLSDEFRNNMNIILSNRNANSVDAAFNKIESLLTEHGSKVVSRAGELGQAMEHDDIIKLALKTYRRTLSIMPAENRGSASHIRNMFMGSMVGEISPFAISGMSWARVHAIADGKNVSETMSEFKQQIYDTISRAKEAYDINTNQHSKFARENKLFAARNALGLKNIASELVTTKLGGWNKMAVGLAVGVMGAGYIGGNPAEPADIQAQNQYARQKATAPDQILYADQNLLPAYQGYGQQGYIININAQQPKGMHNKQAAELIKRAVTSSYNNNTININTNINEHSDVLDSGQMLDYLYSAL